MNENSQSKREKESRTQGEDHGCDFGLTENATGQVGVLKLLTAFLGESVIYGVGASLGGVVTTILIPFLLRNVDAREYGRYALAEMLAALGLIAMGLGLNVGLLAWYPRVTKGERVELVGSIFSLVLLTGALAQAAGLVLTKLGTSTVLWQENMLFLVSAIITAENIWMVFGTMFRAEGWAFSYVRFSLLQAGVELLGIVAMVRREPSAESILEGRLAGDVAQLVLLLPHMIRCRPRWNTTWVRRLLAFSVPLVPATFAGTWLNQFPRLFLEEFAGTSEVGVFAMSGKVAASLSLVFVQPFGLAWMVMLFQIARRSDARQLYGRILTYYVVIGGLLAVTFSTFAPAVVSLFGRKSFQLIPGVIAVLAFANVANGLMFPVNIGPYVTGRTSRAVPAFFYAAIASLPLGYVGARQFGVWGAAAMSLATYLLLAALLLRESQKLYPIEVEWKRLAKGATGLAILAAVMFNERSGKPTHLRFVLLCVISTIPTALLVVVLWILRFFDERETAFARAFLRRLALRW